MRVHVDHSKCALHGQCEITAPAIFEIDDEGDSLVILVPEPDESMRDLVEDAADACPTNAISIA
jgi:ferredoxin